MIDLRWDGGVYYTLGESLAQGKGYRILYEPGEILAVQYPPGLPVLVAAARLLTGFGSIWATCRLLLAIYFLIYCAYLIVVYFLARTFCRPILAFLTACLCLCHMHTFYLSNLCFTELPFMLLSVSFFLCSRRFPSRKGNVACGAMAAACFFLRSAGVVILGAWVVDAIIRKRWRAALTRSFVGAAVFLSWTLYVAWIESGDEFQSPKYEYQRADYMYYNVPYRRNAALVDPFKPELGTSGATGLPGRIFNNISALTHDVGQSLTTDMNLKESPRWWGILWGLGLDFLVGVNVERPVHIILSVLVAAGLVTMILNKEYVIPFYVLGTFALITLTPWPAQFKRYLTPVTPFCALAVFAMIGYWRQGRPPLKRPAPTRWRLAVCGLVLLLTLPPDLFSFYKLFTKYSVVTSTAFAGGESHSPSFLYYGEPWSRFDRAVEWIKNNAAPEDVVATAAPYWVHLRTGRKAVMPPFEDDPGEANRLMADVPVKYLLVDCMEFVDVAKRYGRPAAIRFPDQWRQARRWNSEYGPTIIYERLSSNDDDH